VFFIFLQYVHIVKHDLQRKEKTMRKISSFVLVGLCCYGAIANAMLPPLSVNIMVFGKAPIKIININRQQRTGDVLRTKIPNGEAYIFAYNRAPLDLGATFEACSIGNEDTIVAWPINNTPRAHEIRGDDVKESMRRAIVRGTNPEEVRLRDLQMKRTDGSRRRSRLEDMSFHAPDTHGEDERNTASSSLATSYSPAAAPSVEPVPVFWDSQDESRSVPMFASDPAPGEATVDDIDAVMRYGQNFIAAHPERRNIDWSGLNLERISSRDASQIFSEMRELFQTFLGEIPR
jgi:hypothetical protein